MEQAKVLKRLGLQTHEVLAVGSFKVKVGNDNC